MAAPNSTVRCERIKTQRCCCYKENGVCKGDNVKNGGMRLPHGPPGSDSYRRREKLLQQLGTRFDPPGSGTARTKEAMMASKSLRVSLKHFPGNRTTPSKRREGTRTLRHKASLHGPVSEPIDTMIEDVDAATTTMPSQDGVTRSSRRRLLSPTAAVAAAEPRPGAAGGRMARAQLSDLSMEVSAVAARETELLRELAALRETAAKQASTIENLQRAAREQSKAVQKLESKAETLQQELHATDAAYKQQVQSLKEQLNHADTGHRRLTASMLHEKKFGERCRQYTGFRSAEIFDLWIECLNSDGLLDRVLVKQQMYPPEAEEAEVDDDGETQTRAQRKPYKNRAMSPKDAVFFTLMRCRTGLDIKDIHALFGIGYSTACRYFALYVSFLREWLQAEFPQPTEEQIKRATPVSFKKAFPGRNVQFIIDAHEQQCEEPSNLKCRRTLWSDYKHRTTNKFLGACTPCGACVFASSNYGGKCDDKTLTISSGFMDLLFEGWTTLADKGFMMHAEFAALNHELHTPSHAIAGVPTYSFDESRWTNAIGKTRIHIERMFRRAQEWKILHSIIKVSNMDLAGTVFQVCCLMTNYEPPLIRQGDDALVSVGELQWGLE